MRNFNIDELDNEIRDYASDVEYIDHQHLNNKLHQFLNFLESQPISNRILLRIQEDYPELRSKIPFNNTVIVDRQKREILQSLTTPDYQGAFGYFLITRIYNSERIYDGIYLTITQQWFNSHGDYDQQQEDFNNLLFKPFVKLLTWYISESQSYNENDYFSKLEIVEFSEKLDNLSFDNLLEDIRLGQEVLYEEIQDLKEQLGNMKKKNWFELLKGKLVDLTLSKLISLESFSIIVKAISGQDLKLLE